MLSYVLNIKNINIDDYTLISIFGGCTFFFVRDWLYHMLVAVLFALVCVSAAVNYADRDLPTEVEWHT
jgi:hypothetical protein